MTDMVVVMLNTDRLCLGCMNDCGGEKVCGICGYDSETRNASDCLPTKIWLKDRYLVGKVISKDADGIVYIGWDNAKDSIVSIREFFPDLALRNPDKTVSIAEENKYLFNGGLLKFLEINQKLAESELPSLIPSIDVFEENGTAYVINTTFSGITLEDFLSRNGGVLRWEQARPLFLPLMDTLKGLHEMGIVHGGICPTSILVGRDGKLRLSAVKINNTKPENINDSESSGFLAIEQYSDGAEITAATDVYALSATIFSVLIGSIPPSAQLRLEKDSLTIPAKFAEELPRNVLVALANGLQVNLANRTATINDFRNELVYGDSADGSDINTAHKRKVNNETENRKTKKSSSGVKSAVISAVCTALVFVIIAGVLCLTVFKDYIFPKTPVSDINSSETAPPSSQVIGTTDENIEDAPKQYAVPTLTGKYYSEIIDNADEEEYENFKFSIKSKEYSDKYARGVVCAQSIAAGTGVLKETEIQLTISLGPKEVKIANVLGQDENQAKLELLKQGFIYENIEVVERYDSESTPGVVLEQEPAYGTKTNTDVLVTIYVNSYKEENSDDADTTLYR